MTYPSQERSEYQLLEYTDTAYLKEHPLLYNLTTIDNDTIINIDCPPIGDQGAQESCLGWAMGYGCASILAYNKFQDWEWAKRSPSFLFNQYASQTCDSVLSTSVAYCLYSKGACSYFLMPYNPNDCNYQPNTKQLYDGILNRCMPNVLHDNTNYIEYKRILRYGYPITAITRYEHDFNNMWDENQGIWTSITSPSQNRAHAICIVGYDDHTHKFKAMNSWGTNGGDNGFIWIDYNIVNQGCFCEAYVFTPICSGFVPIINGEEVLCDTNYYNISNIPTNSSVTWSLQSNILPNGESCIIYSGQGTDSISIIKIVNTPMEIPQSGIRDIIIDSLYGTLNVLVAQNNFSNSANIQIKRPTGSTPNITQSNSGTWLVGVNRTFYMNNCTNVPDQFLKWTIQHGLRIVKQGNGTSITYKPLVKGQYTITAKNEAFQCGEKTHNITIDVIKPTLKASHSNNILKVSIDNEEQNNKPKIIELYHQTIGFVQKQITTQNEISFNTGNLPDGIYMILLKEDDNQNYETTKLLIYH